jgi:uncharacterized OB-fold protein
MKRVAAELALDTGHFEAIAWHKGTGVPCADCGQRFPPVVMDFDHRDGETKSGTISTKIGIWGWAGSSLRSQSATSSAPTVIAFVQLAARGGRVPSWLLTRSTFLSRPNGEWCNWQHARL